MNLFFFLGSVLFLLFLNTCTQKPEIQELDNINNSIQGAWELLSYQPQDDTAFIKMEGIIVEKIFSKDKWMSSAFKIANSLVVNVAGGTFQLKEGELFEKVEYHLKQIPTNGETNTFKIELKGDTLYQSGVINPGAPNQYKIEEFWKRIN